LAQDLAYLPLLDDDEDLPQRAATQGNRQFADPGAASREKFEQIQKNVG
jgi:hypothetical protein